VKVKQVEQGNGCVKVGLTIKKSNQVLVMKVKQVEEMNFKCWGKP
jgi:hypothetical protein